MRGLGGQPLVSRYYDIVSFAAVMRRVFGNGVIIIDLGFHCWMRLDDRLFYCVAPPYSQDSLMPIRPSAILCAGVALLTLSPAHAEEKSIVVASTTSPQDSGLF